MTSTGSNKQGMRRFSMIVVSILLTMGVSGLVIAQDHGSGGYSSSHTGGGDHSSSDHTSSDQRSGGHEGAPKGAAASGQGRRGWPHSLVTDPRTFRGPGTSGRGSALEDKVFRGGGRPEGKGPGADKDSSHSHDDSSHTDESSHDVAESKGKGPPEGKGPGADKDSSHSHDDGTHDHESATDVAGEETDTPAPTADSGVNDEQGSGPQPTKEQVPAEERGEVESGDTDKDKLAGALDEGASDSESDWQAALGEDSGTTATAVRDSQSAGSGDLTISQYV